MNLYDAIKLIKPLDANSMELAQKRLNAIAKPLNSLGLLEKTIIKIAGITASDKVDISKRCIVIMCADNGVVAEGVTQTSNEVTAVVTENFTKGMTCVSNMANVARADVIPVDIGIARDISPKGLLIHKISYGTKNMTKESAMTRQQAISAIEVGINMVVELKGQGYKLIATGEMGIGNTTTSSAMTAVMLEKDVEDVTGRGAGLSSEGLDRKINAIKRAIDLNKPDKNDVLDVISKIGGLDIAGLAGVFIGGAMLRIPVVVDGFISAVSALVAIKLCPAIKDYIVASHVSKEPAGQLLIDELGLKPLINCEMCLGEGSGAVAVFPLFDMICEVYNKMGTFEQANFEEYKPLA